MKTIIESPFKCILKRTFNFTRQGGVHFKNKNYAKFQNRDRKSHSTTRHY